MDIMEECNFHSIIVKYGKISVILENVEQFSVFPRSFKKKYIFNLKHYF